MVTRDRPHIARRALDCLAAQTWSHVELVVVDDGDEDYEPVLAPYRELFPIRYERIDCVPGRRLGELRNVALDLARGEFCAQWDDDEWYHARRLEVQMDCIERRGADAAVLRSTLMHVDAPDFVSHPFRAALGGGTPGTIVHRRTRVRYPNLSRHEDKVFLMQLHARMRVGIVDEPHGHLFIRCFHGANTWDRRHFESRLWRTPAGALHYLHARFVRRDVRTHPAFNLTHNERAAADAFLRDSRALGLLQS